MEGRLRHREVPYQPEVTPQWMGPRQSDSEPLLLFPLLPQDLEEVEAAAMMVTPGPLHKIVMYQTSFKL